MPALAVRPVPGRPSPSCRCGTTGDRGAWVGQTAPAAGRGRRRPTHRSAATAARRLARPRAGSRPQPCARHPSPARWRYRPLAARPDLRCWPGLAVWPGWSPSPGWRRAVAAAHASARHSSSRSWPGRWASAGGPGPPGRSSRPPSRYQLPAAALGSGPCAARWPRTGSASPARRPAGPPPTRRRRAVLARHGCLAVLRATYQDATQTFAVTVGVAVLPSLAGRQRRSRRCPAAAARAPWRAGGVVPAAPLVARLRWTGSGSCPGQRAAGPYLVLATVGYADGRPRRQRRVRRPLRQGEMVEPGRRGRRWVAAPARRRPAGRRTARAGPDAEAARRRRRWRRRPACWPRCWRLAAAAVWLPPRRRPTPCATQELWVLNAVDVPLAVAAYPGPGVTVAVIDSGVNPVGVSTWPVRSSPARDLSGVNTPPTQPELGGARHLDGLAHRRARARRRRSSGIMGVAPRSRRCCPSGWSPTGEIPATAAYQHESDAGCRSALAEAISYATAHAGQRHQHVPGLRQGRAGRSGSRSRTRWPTGSWWSPRPATPAAPSGGPRTGQAPYSFPADYPGRARGGCGGQDGAARRVLQRQPVGPGGRARGAACPPRAGTGSTGWSAAPARPAR